VSEQQKISCLLLAAGFSRRMGKPKLQLPWGDSTVLEHSLAAAAGAPFQERLLIVRENPNEFPGFRSVGIGAEAEKGIHRSIRAGIEALAPCEAVCISLADQ
jgi:molybdenum cofactor cytidylyltransferase